MEENKNCSDQEMVNMFLHKEKTTDDINDIESNEEIIIET